MLNIISQGLQLQAASIGEYYRDVFPNESLVSAMADAKRNGVSVWVNIETNRCRICRDCPTGWHSINGVIQ